MVDVDVDEPDEPLVAAQRTADGPTRSLHARAALRARVVTAHGLPLKRVRLEADGALVGGVRADDLGGLGEAGGGVEDAEAVPRDHLGPDAVDTPAELLDEVGGVPRIWREVEEVDAIKEYPYLVASRRGVSEAQVGDVGGDGGDGGGRGGGGDGVDKTGETNGTTGGGNLTATLDGGGGERGGGVGGDVGHTDRRYAITVTDTPPTTRSTHRGSTTTLHTVLTITSVITLPNKVGDVRGSGDDASAEGGWHGVGGAVWSGVGSRHLCEDQTRNFVGD